MEQEPLDVSGKIKIEREPHSYEVALLDPRPNADNSKVFEGKKVYGIEVTIPALAEKCELGNLDPQHTGGDPNRAAIEDAVLVELPPDDALLVTVRPDPDSLGSMAIFNIRHKNPQLKPETIEKVHKVAEADTFSKGAWPGKREIPSEENPWPEGQSELAPVGALSMDFKVPIKSRVEKIQQWLEGDVIPQEYLERIEIERKDIVKAIESGGIKIEERNGIAMVESAHRSGIDMGYRNAPIVIARNPKFQFAGGEPHVKYTVAQYTLGYADLKAALEELKTREAGFGSPQGISSQLSMEDVFEILNKYKKQ